MRNFTKIVLSLAMAFGLLGGVNSVSAAEITKTPILLNGGKFAECLSGTYIIQMQNWVSFIAYEDATGVAFDEDSYMQFDMAESCSNGAVRVTFTFNDESTQQEWWCLGIGVSKDDASISYAHDFDNSKYWLKKGLSSVWKAKSGLKITKVTIDNFGTENLFTYKINGGSICGKSLTLKKGSANAFGAYGGVFSPTTAQTNIFQMNDFAVSDYQKIVIKFGAAVPATGGWKLYNGSLIDLAGKEEYEFALNGTAISDFTIFNLDGNPEPINISEVYFYKDEIGVTPIYGAPAGTTDLKDFIGTNTSWSSNVKYSTKLGGGTALCGDGDGTNEGTHVTITGNDYICFEVTDVQNGGLYLRTWIWDGEVKTLYAYPIANYADATWGTPYTISTPGTYAVKISGYDYLKGVKTYWGEGSITISQAWVNSGSAPADHVFTGKYTLDGLATGSASLTAALADVNATYYDATGITGTGVDLTSVANPNALFKATAGKLSNTNNVIISDICENLVLADNHPFKAPFDFTATAATYNTTINTTAQAGTLYLPYAAAIPAGVDAWTLTYSGGDNVTATKINTGTIPANTPVLLNGSGSKDFTGSSVAIDADATNVSGALTGVFEQGYVPKDSYVLQNKSGVLAFYKVAAENSVTIKPFRAYLTASAGARLYINFDDEETTGITNNKCETTSNNRYFDLQGREVAQPTTGLYIVNGKKVLVK